MWQRVPVCFELVSPLHVGFLPKSPGTVVSPTRPYVPGKNLWGAVTASLTSRLYADPKPAQFAAIGTDVRRQIVFSYCYLSDGLEIFVPSFEPGHLAWGQKTDAEFRAAFLDSRLSTQIGQTGSAEDGSLHEIEFIRCGTGSPGAATIKPVLLCGVVWVNSDGTIDGERLKINGTQLLPEVSVGGVDLFDRLLIGGERNYGFGRIRLRSAEPALIKKLDDLWPFPPDTPLELKGPLLGHCAYQSYLLFKGQIEVISSREYPTNRGQSFEAPGASISACGHFFAPGTVLHDAGCRATFNNIGQVLLG